MLWSRTAHHPSKAILYFLNELDLDPEPAAPPLRAVYEVKFSDSMIQEAIAEFDRTAHTIIGLPRDKIMASASF